MYISYWFCFCGESWLIHSLFSIHFFLFGTSGSLHVSQKPWLKFIFKKERLCWLIKLDLWFPLLLQAPFQRETAIRILGMLLVRFPTSAGLKWREPSLGYQLSCGDTNSSQADRVIPLGACLGSSSRGKAVLPHGAGWSEKGLYQADPAEFHR